MRSLYAQDDNLPRTRDGSACGVDYTAPVTNSCDAQDQLTPLDRQLESARACSRSTSTSEGRGGVENACIDVADQVAAIRSSFIANGGVDDGQRLPDGTVTTPLTVECGFLGYREAWHRAVTDPLATRMEKLVDLKNNAAKDTPETQLRLRLLGRWYDKLARPLSARAQRE